jgi:hypothetical protein
MDSFLIRFITLDEVLSTLADRCLHLKNIGLVTSFDRRTDIPA